jgi:hypothetical protein
MQEMRMFPFRFTAETNQWTFVRVLTEARGFPANSEFGMTLISAILVRSLAK